MGFQSTLPRGERLAYHLLLILFLLFQSTLPRGGRRLCLVFDLFQRKFQFTLPRGERLCRICHSNNIRKNFNPRSHEGSDLCQGNCTLVQEISIHAPTRGATFIRDCEKAIGKISIHAPTRGATMLVMFDDCGLVFQSTLPRGERRQNQMSIFDMIRISIHAPTRGATPADLITAKYCQLISIHAPTRGATKRRYRC